ncbi:MAG: phosphoadenosine phosphosulfate reductase family protein [Bacteroidales bacterium]|jgi:phosphoadenosine phosphosulfate reductase|nr:phosphoadenosine phosphosulfate reductase family protein [Bacteroidales bacterium]
MTKELQKKVDFAIKLLRSIHTDEEIEISFSGGKDSSVILEIAKMAGIKYRAIYKATTIDPQGTIAFCKENGCEIIMPKKTMLQLISERGFPTRRVRYCCEVLKEYKVCNYSVQGIRKCESEARKKRYKEPEICRSYGKDKVKVYFPILEWTDKDVADFIRERGIKCHDLYYKNGKFDVTKRLGCMICPMCSNKNQIEQFKKYPKFVKLWIDRGRIWWNKERKKEIVSKKKFRNVEDLFVHNLFFSNYEDFTYVFYGMFPIDSKEFLEKYFNIKL